MELQVIQNKIHEIRGKKVMLDRDLAELYQVTTSNLNKAVKRNIARFPPDFMFQLSKEEFENLIFQNGTSSWGGTRKLPFAFTEQGLAMLSGLLNSEIAIEINISIMRAFISMREYLTGAALQSAELRELRERIKALEHGSEDTLGAVNDLSEDMRHEIDNLYLAIGELSIKPNPALYRPMGYQLSHPDKK